jgi:hypothetical protein
MVNVKRKKGTKKGTKKKNKTRKKNKQCSPKNKSDFLDYTCYKPSNLYKMRNVWNTRHPGDRIETKKLKEIWDSLGERLKNSCNSEACWIKNSLFKKEFTDKEIKNVFSPNQPEDWKKNPNEWLSSIEISELMKQYEDAYKCFEFIGPTPIDFDEKLAYGECVWNDLCNFNLKEKIDDGINKIGIIFNLDKHDKPGSHWTCMFVSVKLKKIYYFDSYGDDLCPSQVKKLVKKIQKQSKEIGVKYKFVINKTRHQYSRSECGMYCLFFIIQMILDTSFSRFNKKVSDKYMRKLRNIYFNA